MFEAGYKEIYFKSAILPTLRKEDFALWIVYIKFRLETTTPKITDTASSNCQAKCNSLVEKVNRRNKVKTFSGAIVNQIKNSIKALS